MFQQLRYFLCVAECGSINRAAERLFVSQQALRSSINSLEEKLGFALFTRSPKGMQLTEAGWTVLSDVKNILSISDRWKQHACPTVTEAETVEVLASTVVCNSVLTDVVAECRRRYSALRIRLFHARDDEMLDALTPNSIGIIGSAPESIVNNKLRPFAQKADLDMDVFGPDHFCIYLNSKNPLAQQPYLTTHQLKSLTLAAYPGEDQRFFYSPIHDHFSDTPPFFIEKQESIFQIIAEMEDVAAVFPHLAVFNNRYVEQGTITALPVHDYAMPGISCMMYPKSERLTPGQRVVSLLIQQRLSELLRQIGATGNIPL